MNLFQLIKKSISKKSSKSLSANNSENHDTESSVITNIDEEITSVEKPKTIDTQIQTHSNRNNIDKLNTVQVLVSTTHQCF